jgi:hypothetical protein
VVIKKSKKSKKSKKGKKSKKSKKGKNQRKSVPSPKSAFHFAIENNRLHF